MAVPISLGRSGPCTARRHAVDVVLQLRTPNYGPGRIYSKTAICHGRVAFLLLAIAKHGAITLAESNPAINFASKILARKEAHHSRPNSTRLPSIKWNHHLPLYFGTRFSIMDATASIWSWLLWHMP